MAVLPLENLSGDPAQDYFSDGMTDALITELSHIRKLRVISRTSVMQYKRTQKRLADIARDLNVDAVVEGTVVRANGRVQDFREADSDVDGTNALGGQLRARFYRRAGAAERRRHGGGARNSGGTVRAGSVAAGQPTASRAGSLRSVSAGAIRSGKAQPARVGQFGGLFSAGHRERFRRMPPPMRDWPTVC